MIETYNILCALVSLPWLVDGVRLTACSGCPSVGLLQIRQEWQVRRKWYALHAAVSAVPVG
jgi:hypothetical protein